MPQGLCLRALRINEKARVRAITATGELGRRIRDLGLVPGTEITVVGKAPLRDPVALRLRDFTLTMRNNEADHITVDTEE
jgi:ferrous iron transport protein A